MHGLLDRVDERERQRPEFDTEPEVDPGADRSRFDPQADGGQERIRLGRDRLDRRTDADRAFDADCRGFAERRVHAEVIRERGLDDLLLYLAVERYGDLVPPVVLAEVDQRILFGELAQCRVQCCSVIRVPGGDDRLQRWRREVLMRRLVVVALRSSRRYVRRRDPRPCRSVRRPATPRPAPSRARKR